MPFERSFRFLTGRRQTIAGLLVLALLLAQWSGFQHRIAHGGQGGFGFAAPASVSDGNGRSGDALHHSCLDYDAATLAFALHAAVPLVPALPERRRPAPRLDFASWDAPFPRHFLTRAPPAA
ncbi:MAG: hypothetical protein WA924_11025 [Burkholderiaceae bacterium]